MAETVARPPDLGGGTARMVLQVGGLLLEGHGGGEVGAWGGIGHRFQGEALW